jgi:hypothetical protein
MEVNIGVGVKFGQGEDGPEMVDLYIKSEATAKISGENAGYEIKKTMGTSFVNGEHEVGDVWFK